MYYDYKCVEKNMTDTVHDRVTFLLVELKPVRQVFPVRLRAGFFQYSLKLGVSFSLEKVQCIKSFSVSCCVLSPPPNKVDTLLYVLL